MSEQNTNWFRRIYRDGVIQKLQARGWLLKGTAMAGDMNGNEVRWLKGGRIEAEEIDRSMEDARMANAERTFIDATMKDYAAASFVKIIDLNKMGPNAIDQSKNEGAAAVGRKMDLIQLQEMNAAAEAGSVETIGDGTAVIDILDMQDSTGRILGIGAAELNMTFTALPMFAFQQLSNYKEFNSADYTGPDLAFTKMTTRRTWHFSQYIVLPDEYFEALGGSKTTFFHGFQWNVQCIGFERNGELQTPMNYLAMKRGWMIDNVFGAVSKVLQAEGIKRLKFKWQKPVRPA